MSVRIRRIQPFPLFERLQRRCRVTVTVSRQFGGLHRKERWRRRARTPGRPCPAAPRVHLGSILGVEALLAHGGQLATLRHEHDDKGYAGAGYQTAGHTHILKYKNLITKKSVVFLFSIISNSLVYQLSYVC